MIDVKEPAANNDGAMHERENSLALADVDRKPQK